MIRKAVKLTRNESLAEAEALLRRVLEVAPANSAAKVELAFLLTKQRRLTDAYNLVFPVAEAEPSAQAPKRAVPQGQIRREDVGR